MRTISISESVSASPAQRAWPQQVPPIGHPDHEKRLIAWLLDVLPSELRSFTVLRRHLPALLHFAESYVLGSLNGVRNAYSAARAELAGQLPPEAIAASLKSYEHVGQELRFQYDFIVHMREHHFDDD